ncbi:MAG: hypothetical protein WC028_02895 [Candidatus Obscuribacterales bacterium]
MPSLKGLALGQGSGAEDPTSPLPAMTLSNLRTGASVNCEVLDSR